jgi:hypothetical protein
MSPTSPSLLAFRIIVVLGVVATFFSLRSGARYFFVANLIAWLLAIFAVQSFGQVIRKEGLTETPDRLTQAMNGPNGLRVRAGLFILVILFVLMGLGVIEPTNLIEWLLRSVNAA